MMKLWNRTPIFTVFLALIAATSLLATAQTVTLSSGQSCNYSTFVFTPPANYNFQCGGSSGPGTIQFGGDSSGVNQGASQTTITVTRTNGTSGAVSGTVSVATASTAVCTLTSPAAGTVNFADTISTAIPLTVTTSAQGTCTLNLASSNLGSPNSVAFQVVDPAAPGTIAFQNANPPANPVVGATITIPVVRSAAGTASTAATASYTCNTGTTGANVTSANPLNFGAGNGTQNITLSATTTTGPITCDLTGVSGGPALVAPTQHSMNVSPVPAPTCAPTATPNSFATGVAQNVALNSACTGTNAGTTYTWSALAGNTILPSPTNTATSQASFSSAAAAGGYGYRLIACNGAACTANLDVTVTLAPPTANCYQFDAPEVGFTNDFLIAKDRTTAMRVPKARLRNFTWYNFDSFAVMQVSTAPCSPSFTDPATLPLSSDVFRSTCEFSIYFSYQNITLESPAKCNLPSVPDGGYYYVNFRPVQPNSAGSALTLNTPTNPNICTGPLPGGGLACVYRVGF